jgi:hypothetical protein
MQQELSGARGLPCGSSKRCDSKQKFDIICDASGDAGLINTLNFTIKF